MIIKHYPSKRPVVKSNFSSPFMGSEESRATKCGLSIEEYRERCRAVVLASATCSMWKGMKVVPVKEADFLEHGVMTVLAVCRHFDQYGDIAWNDPPFILALSSGNKPGETINCTANWARTPTSLELKDAQNVC